MFVDYYGYAYEHCWHVDEKLPTLQSAQYVILNRPGAIHRCNMIFFFVAC